MLTPDQEKSLKDKRESLRYLEEDMPSVLKDIISEYSIPNLQFAGNFDYITLEGKREKVLPGDVVRKYKGSTATAWFEKYKVGVKYNVNIEKEGPQRYNMLYDMEGNEIKFPTSMVFFANLKLSCSAFEIEEKTFFTITLEDDIVKKREIRNALLGRTRLGRTRLGGTIVSSDPTLRFGTVSIPGSYANIL